jgi:hypothetical protein
LVQGGDEVAVDCWLHDPAIKQWGLKHNLTDPYRMFAYFEERLATLVQPSEATAKGRVRPPMAKQDSSLPPYINRTMVVWQDVWDDNWAHLAHEETVVEVWLDQNTLAGVIDKGYRAIWAYPWYLDQQVSFSPCSRSLHSRVPVSTVITHLADKQNPGMAPKKSSYEWVDTWMAFYEAEPFRGLNMTEEQENMMLGGEGCMWGENVRGSLFVLRMLLRLSHSTCSVCPGG